MWGAYRIDLELKVISMLMALSKSGAPMRSRWSPETMTPTISAASPETFAPIPPGSCPECGTLASAAPGLYALFADLPPDAVQLDFFACVAASAMHAPLKQPVLGWS